MARIPKTQKKLREAGFFLSHMSKATRAPRLDTENFDFCLSAFLSAGRSVTFVLQWEQKDSYDAWFPNWVSSLGENERKLLDFMNAQRRAEVHVQGAETQGDIEMVPLTQFDWDHHGHPAYDAHWYGPPGVPPPEMGVMVYYFETAGQKERAIDKCERYLALLDKLVGEFDLAFPSAPLSARSE